MDEMASTTGSAPPMRPMVVLEEVQPVDIRGAIRYVFQHKWLVVAATLVCGIAGMAYAFLAPQWFRAEVVMIPVAQKSPLSNLGDIGGLASLAGINLGGGSGDEGIHGRASVKGIRRRIHRLKESDPGVVCGGLGLSARQMGKRGAGKAARHAQSRPVL